MNEMNRVTIRIIDALQRPDVLDGSMWMALPLLAVLGTNPSVLSLPQQTIGIDPERRAMYWCDGIFDPRAARPSYFSSEAALTLRQLLGECTLVNAKRGER